MCLIQLMVGTRSSRVGEAMVHPVILLSSFTTYAPDLEKSGFFPERVRVCLDFYVPILLGTQTIVVGGLSTETCEGSTFGMADGSVAAEGKTDTEPVPEGFKGDSAIRALAVGLRTATAGRPRATVTWASRYAIRRRKYETNRKDAM